MNRKIVVGMRALTLTLAAGLVAAACSVSETRAPSRFVITGPSPRVEQYLARQSAWRPELRPSVSAPDSQGRVEATVILPKTFAGDDVLQMANSASDAKLTWSYTEGGSTRTMRLG